MLAVCSFDNISDLIACLGSPDEGFSKESRTELLFGIAVSSVQIELIKNDPDNPLIWSFTLGCMYYLFPVLLLIFIVSTSCSPLMKMKLYFSLWHQNNSQACRMFSLTVHLLQVIALNSSHAAEGELYIDNGKSFEFKQGAYIHRHFVFSDGKLTSSSLVPNASKTLFSSACVIERIIVLGHSSGPKNALIEPSNRKAEIELGPLWLRRGKSAPVLTIRRPNVPVADDWTIKIL